MKLVIDSSSDGRRAAYACLVVDPPLKPRLIYGVRPCINMSGVEAWGINCAVRRTNARYQGLRPLLVFTDNLSLVQIGRPGWTQLRWLSRDEKLMQHLHKVANSLRRAM